MIWHFCNVSHATASRIVYIAPPSGMCVYMGARSRLYYSLYELGFCLCFKIHRKMQTRLSEVSLWPMLLHFIKLNTRIYHNHTILNHHLSHFLLFQGWILHVFSQLKRLFFLFLFSLSKISSCLSELLDAYFISASLIHFFQSKWWYSHSWKITRT